MVDIQSDGYTGSRPMPSSLYSPNTSCPSWMAQKMSRGVNTSS